MSRAHDDRKELREGVLSSSGSRVMMNPGMPTSSLDKEKHEMQGFGGEPTYSHRTLDLINKQHVNSLSARMQRPMGSVGPFPPMPPLQAPMLPSILPGGPPMMSPSALPHGPILRGGGHPGRHPFPSHIPTGIVAAAAAVAPPRASIGPQLRTSIPPLKQSQIQLPGSQISGKQQNMFSPVITSNRPQSTTSGSLHAHPGSDHRPGDSRMSHMSDLHHARSGTATIQVIASGTASQPPHSNHTNKSLSLNASQNVLKIGSPNIQQSVHATHSSSSSTPVSTVATFKFAGSQNNITIGKLYQAPPSIIIPSTSAGSLGPRNDHQTNLKVPDHRISSVVSSGSHAHHLSQLSSAHHPSYPSHSGSIPHPTHTGSSSESKPERTHPGNPSVSYTIGPCFMDPGGFSPVIGMHSFPHNFHLRPPPPGPGAFGSLPTMFTVDSTRGLHSGPLTFGHFSAGSKGNPSSDVHPHSSSADGTHLSNTFTIQNLYPNLQPSNLSGQMPVTPNNAASPRPSILRKRTHEGYSTHSDRISSPTKSEPRSEASIPTSHSRQSSPKPSSDNSSDVNKSTTPIRDTSSQPNSNTTPTITDVKREADTQPVPPTTTATTSIPVLNSVHQSLISSSFPSSTFSEASPRKKPRKQHVITTEDKYSSAVSMEPYDPDNKEKLLKPSIKDYAKESPLAKLSNVVVPSSLNLDVKSESASKELTETDDALKYYLFRRRPRISIIGDYKLNPKAAHNHFYRLSDVRPKEEKKMTVNEIVNQKKFLQGISGWKLFHISSQLDELSSLEEDLCKKMCDFQKKLSRPSKQYMSSVINHGVKKSSVDEQLRVLHELIQGNIQRCQLSVEQLGDAKRSMLKVLDFKPKVLEVMKKHKHKRTSKKKSTSS